MIQNLFGGEPEIRIGDENGLHEIDDSFAEIRGVNYLIVGDLLEECLLLLGLGMVGLFVILEWKVADQQHEQQHS